MKIELLEKALAREKKLDKRQKTYLKKRV